MIDNFPYTTETDDNITTTESFLENVQFINNSATDQGGGMKIECSKHENITLLDFGIKNVIFIGNSARNSSGALHIENKYCIIDISIKL